MMALVLLFSSCQLGKHYVRPELNLPQQLDSTEQDTLSLADRQWWELYTDTTLQALIERTLEYNKDMKIAAARVKELAAMKRIDFANLFSASQWKAVCGPRKRKTMAETIMIQTGAMKQRQSFHGKWIFGETYVGRKIRVCGFLRFDRGAAGTENELGGRSGPGIL